MSLSQQYEEPPKSWHFGGRCSGHFCVLSWREFEPQKGNAGIQQKLLQVLASLRRQCLKARRAPSDYSAEEPGAWCCAEIMRGRALNVPADPSRTLAAAHLEHPWDLHWLSPRWGQRTRKQRTDSAYSGPSPATLGIGWCQIPPVPHLNHRESDRTITWLLQPG